MNIKGTFKFNNIGQGLFYSGLLINKNDLYNHKIFSFVYDCGTESSKINLNRNIDSFKALLPSDVSSGAKKLNLLVISHLHDDHVNGLECLLDGVKVDTVVMPFLDDGLKSLPLLESTGEDEFLSDLYRDSVEWFASKGVRRIFLLVGEDTIFEKNEESLDIAMIPDDSDIIVEPGRVSYKEKVEDTYIALLKSHSTVTCPKFGWEFHFENLKLDPKLINKYTNIVKEYEDKHGSLEDILKDRNLTKNLMKDIRQTPCKNILNRTSVILLHQPTTSDAHARLSLCNCHLCRYRMLPRHIKTIYCGSILTGDIHLYEGESFQIIDYSPPKPLYSVIQFPHHGANNIRNIAYFGDLPAIATVLSYGKANKYDHPNGKVVNHLRRPVLVNENRSFEYQIFVYK